MRIANLTLCLLLSGISLQAATAWAAEKTVAIYAISESGKGKPIGTLQFSDSEQGLKIVPLLKHLSPGIHGFHVHENASCDAAEKDGKLVAGLAAGGHFDPAKTGKHEGPMGQGHHGDLPALQVEADGTATAALIAPHLSLADLSGHAIIIHEGGDNYSDTPKPLGGGGGRVACGIVE